MIEVTRITKTFQNKKAVDSLSFRLEKGEIVGLLGLNGAGKTTTIRILTGFLIPTMGEAKIGGASIFEEPRLAKQSIGYLPETPPLYEDFTVYEYLEFVSRIKSVPVSEIPAGIQKIAAKTNLTDVIHRRVGDLSLGFRKRVGIAQALLGEPKVVILDEPISGLDPKQIIEIRNLIRSLKGEQTVLISSHILTEIYKTCDKFLLIHNGKLKQEITLEELESRMQKIAGVKLRLRANSKEDVESFLKQISLEENADTNWNISSEDNSHFVIFGNPKQEDKWKYQLFKNAPDSKITLDYVEKREVNLEEFFLETV